MMSILSGGQGLSVNLVQVEQAIGTLGNPKSEAKSGKRNGDGKNECGGHGGQCPLGVGVGQG
jgi:hypothetical protein